MRQATYQYNVDTKKTPHKASEALQWHKEGHAVAVTHFNPLHTVTVKGAAPQKIDENFEHCKSIAYEIEAYIDGEYHTCPECGETVKIPQSVGDKFKCPHCGEVNETDDFEELTLYDYFEDMLDIDYLVNYKKEYQACKICVAWGGPSIYIDTESGYVELYWWSETAKFKLRSDAINAIDEWAEDYFNMM